MNHDIRRQQRFHNYEQEFLRLQEAVGMQSLNELERNGLTQRFELEHILCRVGKLLDQTEP